MNKVQNISQSVVCGGWNAGDQQYTVAAARVYSSSSLRLWSGVFRCVQQIIVCVHIQARGVLSPCHHHGSSSALEILSRQKRRRIFPFVALLFVCLFLFRAGGSTVAIVAVQPPAWLLCIVLFSWHRKKRGSPSPPGRPYLGMAQCLEPQHENDTHAR